jgi:Fe-S oxidoreductase
MVAAGGERGALQGGPPVQTSQFCTARINCAARCKFRLRQMQFTARIRPLVNNGFNKYLSNIFLLQFNMAAREKNAISNPYLVKSAQFFTKSYIVNYRGLYTVFIINIFTYISVCTIYISV